MSTRSGDATAPCGRCGLAYDAHRWSSFELVERMDGDRVRELVTGWPEGAVIEVRRCACGRPVARTLPPQAGASPRVTSVVSG